MRLLLIRHGQTPANVRGELDTAAPGPGLTALGHAQAAALPAALAHEPIDAVFASTLTRTQQTATPLADARGVPLVVLPGVHEVEGGDFEMATDHESYRRYFEVAIAWGGGRREVRMPGAEDGHAFFERFDASIAAAASTRAESIVVVTHSVSIRVWVAGTAKNLDPAFTVDQELDNTGMVVLEGSPAGGWDFVSWYGKPLGGTQLADGLAEDPTGDPLDEELST